MDNNKEGACWVFLFACSLRFPCHFLINDWGLYIPNWSIYGQQPSVIKTFFPVAPLVVFVLVPAVGMRLWSEERRLGTMELLLTMPISLWHCIVGKFIASWLFLTLALILTFPIWITVNYLGDPDNNVIFSSYIGSFFLAGAYLSVTSMTSAFTRNQVISFILSVVIGFW